MRSNPFRELPDHVTINGTSCKINPSFRVCVSIELECLKEEKPDIAGLLRLFYCGNIPTDIKGAVSAMIDFYRGHDEKQEGTSANTKKREGRIYDFEQDAEVILSSFLGSYGIDLTHVDMHWWEFRRLLFNLPHESSFMQRVMYRTADLGKVSKAQRKHYKKMKELYAIKDVHRQKFDSVEERDAAFLAKINKRFEEAEQYARKKEI